MNIKKKEHVRTTVILPREVREILDEIAKTGNVSVSWVVRQAIDFYFAHKKIRNLPPLLLTKKIAVD